MTRQKPRYNLFELIETYKGDVKGNHPDLDIREAYKRAAEEYTKPLISIMYGFTAAHAIIALTALVLALRPDNTIPVILTASATAAALLAYVRGRGYEKTPAYYDNQFINGKINPEATGLKKIFEKTVQILEKEYGVARKDIVIGSKLLSPAAT